jgi:hypothetical protein
LVRQMPFFLLRELATMSSELDNYDDGQVTTGERVWYFINGLAVVAPQICKLGRNMAL